MHLLRNILAVILMVVSFGPSFTQNEYNIDIQIENATSDTLYLAYFYGDAQYVRDTAYRNSDGVFSFRGDEALPEGVYMFVMPPANSFFQVLIDGDQTFSMTTDAQEISASTVIEGHEDNAIFYDYLKLIDQARKQKSASQKDLENASDQAAKDKLEEHILELDKQVLGKQDQILQNHPNSLSALVIGASRDPVIPDFPGLSDEEKKRKGFQYFREHYFDQIDLHREAVLRTPFIHQKVMDYFDKYTSQDPDSLNRAIDGFFAALDEESTIYRYFLVKLLNKYANPTIVGQDAVYVHLAQQYYGKGKAPWVDEETLLKILDNAERFSYTLIGKEAPPLKVYDVYDEKELEIKDIPGKYKVLIFWSSSCNHCEKVMPTLPEIQNSISDSTVRFVTVCTKADESCKTFLDQNDLGSTGIHSLPVSSYGRLYDVRSTPKVFVIDSDNKIVSKGIGFEQIAQVIDMLKKNG
ncbi:MAG TPA: redoxin domain-containing protein [Membranihabitans sp.]|nr:redoxin domain-containing protein [Membranihabitans sp.]